MNCLKYISRVSYLFAIVGGLVFSQSIAAQNPIPADEQAVSILITNVTIHIGNGKEIQDGAVGFKNGIIDFVGSAALAPKGYGQVIDEKGKHLYPGFIAVDSALGLKEIGAVRASKDERETGGINPHVRSIIAYNTDSRITPTVRSNGVLMGQISPRGGRISGTSSVVSFDAWNWEDATHTMDDGIYVNWPRTTTWNHETRRREPNKKYQEQVDELKQFLSRAQAYSKAPDGEMQVKEEACRGLFSGEKKLYVRTDRANAMIGAINMAKDLEISDLIIVGGHDAHLITDLLTDEDIAVIITSVHGIPDRAEDDIDHNFKLAKVLSDAGVRYCLGNSDRMSEMNTMNLPFQAGTCVAYGLDAREAISAISLNAAEILGIDNRCGSVEVGKDATLFVSSGDALDMRSNDIQTAFIQGRLLDLDNHQKFLDRKYRKKYGLLD